jgi:hypothetical protein
VPPPRPDTSSSGAPPPGSGPAPRAVAVRPLGPCDRDALAALVAAAFHADYRTTAEVAGGIASLEEKRADLLREHEATPARFRGALLEGRLVGVAVVREDALGRLWLDDLLVEPAARRAGGSSARSELPGWQIRARLPIESPLDLPRGTIQAGAPWRGPPRSNGNDAQSTCGNGSVA